jgi:hypothetical protein
LRATVNERVPVEAEGWENGVPIDILLHVVDGYLAELEVLRMDSKPLQSPLEIAALELFPRDDPK